MPALLDPTTRGRDHELEIIGEQLDRVRSGSGAVVVIEGVPGLGKSRLLREAADSARRLSIRVGIGGAEPSESVVELAPLLRALSEGSDPLLDRVALGELRAIREQRYWVLEKLGGLLERRAMRGPILICLDDLHRADPGTIAAVRMLPARLASLPIGWLLAQRPDETAADLRDATDALTRGDARRFVLEPLDRAAVVQVTTEVLQATPDAELLTMSDGAGGNPYLLVELLLGLRQEGLVQVTSGRARLVEDRLPRRVGAGMRQRLARMSESARQLATVAASLGRTFSFSELSAMLGVPPSALVTPAAQLLEADLLRERGDRLSFRHDLTREAVRLSSPASARRALDRQAADALLAAGAPPTEVARQLAASAERGDEGAIATLDQAAQALGSTDPKAAAEISRRALLLTTAAHPRRAALVAQTTLLLHAAGAIDEASAFADRYLTGALSTSDEAAVRLGIASMFGLSPDVRVSAGRAALALTDLAPDDRAKHLSRVVYNLVQAGRAPEAKRLVATARIAVQAADDSPARSILMLADGALLYTDGRFGRALELHEAAMRHGFGTDEATRFWVAQQWRSELLAVLERLDESMQLISDGIASAQRDRQGWAVEFFETWRGRQLLQRGRLSHAAATLEGRFDAGYAHQMVGSLYAAGLVALGRVAIHTADAPSIRETAELARAMLRDGTPSTRRHAAWLLALQAMTDGDAPGARRWLAAPEPVGPAGVLPLFPMDVTDDPHLVRIALAAGDRVLAEAALTAAQERALHNPHVRAILAAAGHCRGLLHDDPERLAEACTLLDGGGRPLALASALEDLGRAQLRAGARGYGVEALGRALVIYTESGASWDAGRVRARLRANGVRRRLTPAERPASGWEALTGSELAVSRLVAEGLTNRAVAARLFVSPHTVSSHLRHTFTKLGVNSRVELSRLVNEQDRSSSSGT